ncbi:Protein-S-isoprenylcysteine O-methyltransferase Ste14 [Loktanella fryxellensis]|uniref:Protein-S-isoprenylcysteine O-methyltransferase Ste14 n=1 Tax=Loktanella fryxellensis TaxID=245187 RepID=A0A1H8F8P4_9RHOB|nr:isoprenylcysteine carboxylmethyltransferase family protein [Loktanella fryxellensis]SEN27915.1 Protein-S-isoprenylcysteine O-methyltransferase Ste14 [Loktanella fryxellensis]
MTTVFAFVAGIAGFAYFVMIAAATKQHFAPGKYPVGMMMISVLSLIGISAFMAFAFLWTLQYLPLVLILIAAAFALFLWAARHSRNRKLSLAFANELQIDGIVKSGPWQYVRHPFYVSYILFWMACAIGTMHLVSVIVFATLLFVYIYSAIREEKSLMTSRHGDDYVSYRNHTGFLFPKLSTRVS